MWQTEPYRTAVKLQRLIVETTKKKECTPAALAQLARAWDVLEERKRVMKMRPAPKPVDTTTLAKRSTVRANVATPEE